MSYVAKCQLELGNFFTDLGRIEEAETAFQCALDIYKEVVPKHPAYLFNYAQTQNNLGILYCKTERFGEAEKYLREGLKIYEKLANEHPKVFTSDVIHALENLSILYDDLGRPEEGEKVGRKIKKLEETEF